MDAVARNGSRPRLVLGLAAVVATVCVGLALWSVSSDRAGPATLPVVESHGLTADQATCLDLAVVMGRSDAQNLEVELGKYQGLDPGAELVLRTEVAELDAVPDRHPDTDSQLVKSIRRVADQGSAVLVASDSIAYRTAVTGWSASSAAARRDCLELADFDVEALDIRQSGR